MKDISYLIEYENENTNLDFKSIQYKKEQNENFLKDILSFANSITKEAKYIIIGVKHKPNGERELLGIEEDFIDDATYQQLVDSNIEPNINFSYTPFEYKNKVFGVFKINNCDNPPYMMKKNNGKLKLGDAFIRKGSFQTRLSRTDFDNLNKLYLNKDISDKINLSLEKDSIIKSKKIDKIDYELPSDLKRKEIERVINLKEKSISPLKDITISSFSPFTYIPYEKRSLNQLKENLENVKSDFKKSDLYCCFEKNAHKINFYIHNESSDFLEDVSIEIFVEKSNSFIITEKIYTIAQSSNPFLPSIPITKSYEQLHYPNVELTDSIYKISCEIDKIKHKLPTQIFKVPIRIAIPPKLKNVEINFNIKLIARNIKKPISNSINITIE